MNPRPPTIERRILRGTLTTTSPLHVGTGVFAVEGGTTGAGPQVAQVHLTREGLPFVPGSSLKGAIRAVMLSDPNHAQLRAAFGAMAYGNLLDPRVDSDAGQGASVIVFDAIARVDTGMETETHVAIDGQTRTADDRKLFQRKAVAAGAVFEVTIHIEGTEHSAAIAQALLAALDSADDADNPAALRLGAHTNSGMGRVQWQLTEHRYVDTAALLAWLNDTAAPAKPQDVASENSWHRYKWSNDDLVPKPFSPPSKLPWHKFAFCLQFVTPFLVADPDQQQSAPSSDAPRPLRPRRRPTREGEQAVLPETSLRGALRARAERIVNTLSRNNPNHDTKDLLTRLFGNAGQQSALHVDPIRAVKSAQTPRVQDFVAIDRFTGGVAGSGKFQIEAFDKPHFTCTLHLNGARFCRTQRNAARALLLLALRDLRDGDMTLGYGAAKGYGACKASFTRPANLDADLSQILPALLDVIDGKSCT
jgi:CRISPR/Cas system CSM-associated protein Csm3 (group 7 of RAMP superfamily)